MNEEKQKNKVNLTLLRLLIDEYGGVSEVARKMGYSKSLICLHYNGTRSVSIDSLVEYAKLFNVSTDKLLGLSAEPVSEKLLTASEYTNLPMSIVNQLHENENRDAEFVAYMLRCRKGWDKAKNETFSTSPMGKESN